MQGGIRLSERSSRSPLKRQRDLKRLNDTWIEHQTDQDYQDIALTYLQNCSDEKATAAIQEEINSANNRQSFSYSISECKGQRSIILFKLQRQLQTVEARAMKTEAHVETLCGFISELRDINFTYAELLINIHNHFRAYLQQEIYSRTIAQIFESLDSARVPLTRSFMGKFILFKKTYDPFFLKHHEMLKRLNHPHLKKLKCVEDLFTVQMNYIYKLQRAHRFIQLYFQKPLLPENVRPKKFRVLSPIRRKNQITSRNSHKQNEDESALGDVRVLDNFNSAFRLDKDIYLSDSRTSPLELNVPRLNIRKKSDGDEPYPEEARTNSHSIRSMRDKKDYYLPRLNSIQSNRKHADSTLDFKNTRESSSYSKRYNAHSTINQIDERDRELKNLFNLRRTQKDSREKHNRSLKKQWKRTLQVGDSDQRQISVQVDVQSQANHLARQQIQEQSRQSSLSRETLRQAPVAQPPVASPPSPPPDTSSKIRTYKIKFSIMSVEECMSKLRNINIHESYRPNLASLSTNFQQSFKSNVYYCHTQFINSELSSIALCLATPDGSIAIKYWAPIASCDPEMSSFLFKKYIEHIEKNTITQKLYFNNNFMRELMEHQFSPTKQRLYERPRVHTTIKQIDNYHPFLNLSFSSLAINKNITNQNSLILSDKLQDFNYAKFVCFNYLLIINKYSGSQIGSDTSSLHYYPKIKSIKQARLKLLSHKMEIQSYNESFKCDYCNLLTLILKEVTFRSKFLANKGFLKIIGNIFFEKDERIIIKVAMQNNFSLYFGKGIQTAMEMAELYKKYVDKAPSQAISISVRMFKKRLRGRLLTINLKDQNLFGDLQISFGWRDYLEGKIQVDASNGEQIFDSTFYCLIEMAKQILFVFEVAPENFINTL